VCVFLVFSLGFVLSIICLEKSSLEVTLLCAEWDVIPCSNIHLLIFKHILILFSTQAYVCLSPFGHIFDAMLVWREGNIKKTVSLCYSIAYCYNSAQCGTSSSYRSGFDLAWLDRSIYVHLCIFALYGDICVQIVLFITFFTSPF